MIQKFTDSPLATYQHFVSGRTPNRTHAIDTITPHIVVGQCTLSSLGATFDDRNISANYGIAADGEIGIFCHEKDQSWCSSNRENDNRSITIECASDVTAPYAINDKVYKSLVALCVDICKRNNIPELRWKADKKLIGMVSQQNITVHRWFANKSCPGDYVYNRLGQIASEVNAILNGGRQSTIYPIIYKVQTGAFKAKSSATSFADKLKKLGYAPYICQISAGLYRVQVGAFQTKKSAYALRDELTKKGFNSFVTTTSKTKSVSSKKTDSEIAKEVITGLWGYGVERKELLAKAGYNYDSVQKEVNKLL